MKKYLLILFVLLSAIGYTQNGINYKALIKDNSGNVIANTTVQIQFTIVQDVTNVYTEIHSPTTDANGIIIVNIGEGTATSGDFNTINWATTNHSLNVQIDTGSGFVDLGTTQFMSVPYAKYAETTTNATNVNGLEALDEGNGIGWRLVDRNAAFYGDIGQNAVDLSFSNSGLIPKGALGLNSFATGFFTVASGDYATSMGFNTEASGNYSTSLGFNTETLGDYAIASGRNSSASGEYATALGYFANASDIGSTALGYNTTASGGSSTAMGSGTTASGNNSTAMGVDTESSVYASTAMGSGTTASGGSSTAMGFDTTASGGSSTAMGSGTTASGGSSTAMGSGTIASEFVSTAMGRDTEASGWVSTTMGSNTEASGQYSTAMGNNTTASGDYSTAMGNSSSASGDYSTATGFITVASGNYSTAMGFRNLATSLYSTAIGSYNVSGGSPDTWIETDPIFEIGNSNSFNERSNAVTVLKNGNVGIGTHTPQERLHILGRLRIGTETIEDSGTNRLSFNADLLPDGDNAFRLGNSSDRWTSVWAADGTINTSDRREKENIENLNYGLKEVLQMNPVSFNWKNKNNPDTKLGLIAQDVLKIVPEVVKTHIWKKDEVSGVLTKKELDRLGVYYSDLIPVLIKAIQEQQEIIKNYQREVISLQSTVNTQDSKIEALSSLYKRMEALETLLITKNEDVKVVSSKQ